MLALWARTASLGPVVPPAFSARLLRVRFANPLRERGRLTFPAPAYLFDELLQLGDPFRLELDQLAQLGVLVGQALNIRRRLVSRNSQRYARSARTWWTPLNEDFRT